LARSASQNSDCTGDDCLTRQSESAASMFPKYCVFRNRSGAGFERYLSKKGYADTGIYDPANCLKL
jgi:hypothetical protein